MGEKGVSRGWSTGAESQYLRDILVYANKLRLKWALVKSENGLGILLVNGGGVEMMEILSCGN